MHGYNKMDLMSEITILRMDRTNLNTFGVLNKDFYKTIISTLNPPEHFQTILYNPEKLVLRKIERIKD